MATTYDRTYVDADGYEHHYRQHEHAEGETVPCAYCRADVRGCGDCAAPPAEDDEAWTELAAEHAPGCEWVATRAHRLETR